MWVFLAGVVAGMGLLAAVVVVACLVGDWARQCPMGTEDP